MTSNFWFALISVGCLAPLYWAVAWGFRYVPLPIENPFIRLAIIFPYGAAIGGIPIAEIHIYRYLTGIRNVSRDNVFMSSIFIQIVIFCIILFRRGLADIRNRPKQTPPGDET
jgi:hypothetical protein